MQKQLIKFSLIFILSFFNQSYANSPFTYGYKTEILASNLEESFELKKSIENFAEKLNYGLNHTIFFNTKFIRQPKEVRKYCKENLKCKFLEIEKEDGQKVHCTFFDRGSDKLLIVGGGFTNAREIMFPFVGMFHDKNSKNNTNIALLDYRGHGLDHNPLISFTKKLFDVDCGKTRLGKNEHEEVLAVVEYFKKTGKYKQIDGLGVCYSALIFIKAAAISEQNNTKLFDHIILDGCWLSLQNFVEKIAHDPKLIFSPQYGGWSKNWFVKKDWFQRFGLWLAQKLFHTKFNEVSILDHLQYLTNTPILYFYGKDDLVINRKEFETIWKNIKTEKTAIITSNPHVINHIKQKELYKLICDLFLELPHDEFISCLKNIETLAKYHIDEFRDWVSRFTHSKNKSKVF